MTVRRLDLLGAYYNLTVAGIHTYYISDSNVLVHNDNTHRRVP